jgi:hypothetical protein
VITEHQRVLRAHEKGIACRELQSTCNTVHPERMSATYRRHIQQFPVDQLNAVALVQQAESGHLVKLFGRPAVVRQGSTL